MGVCGGTSYPLYYHWTFTEPSGIPSERVKKLIVVHWSRSSVEPKGSLLSSQEPITGPLPEINV
jgi:hypothetical protein